MQMEDKGRYDKKIVYLDYLERGEKVKNGGFLKMELRGDIIRMQIHIRGLYATDTIPGQVQLLSRGRAVTADSMTIKYGTGEYVAVWQVRDLAGTGIGWEECEGIQILISEKRKLLGRWREALPLEEPVEEVLPVTEVSEEPEQILEPTSESALESEPEYVQETASETVSEAAPEIIAQEEPEEEVPGIVRIKEAEKPMKPIPESRFDAILADKWAELGKRYPRIHPFGDEREYLSIAPRDFVVLPKEYQKLVQNSFLLHGYYNYGHVILTKIKEKGEDRYYLGVPGVYYEREKQAALMFGFEGFEAGAENSAEGGFGYYMKQVEI